MPDISNTTSSNGKVISFLSNTSWSLWNFRKDILKGLSEHSNEISIIAPVDQFTPNLIKEGYDFHECYMSPRGTSPASDLSVLVKLIRIYRQIAPKVAIQYTIKPNIYGPIACAINGIKSIAVVTGLGYTFTNESLKSTFARFLYRIGLYFASEVWFLNRDDIDTFVNDKIVPREKCFLMPGEGVDTNFFSPILKEHRNDHFTFLMVARFLKEKGIYEYAQAAAEMIQEGYKVKFQLIGKKGDSSLSAVDEEDLAEWMATGVLEVLPETDQIRNVIGVADCVVLPSYREGLSRSLLEAASMEKPVIASRVPGCEEVVKEGKTGFLVKPKDSGDLKKSMVAMQSLSRDELVEMGKNGRRLVQEQFSNEKVLSFYLERLA